MVETQSSTSQGYRRYTLRNKAVSITVVPELGAKIVSLLDLSTGREWLWAPTAERKLFRNEVGTPFQESPLIGVDECLPTIVACNAGGQSLPDHGEAWNLAWSIDEKRWGHGEIETNVSLPTSKLSLTRNIQLSDNCIHLRYRVRNTGEDAMPCLWAFHPLLVFEPGDRIELPSSVQRLKVNEAQNPTVLLGTPGVWWTWPAPFPSVALDRADFGPETDSFAKLFAEMEGEAWAQIRHRDSVLRFEWAAQENPFLGVWITKGGWNGFTHVALEPTNAPFDDLSDAMRRDAPGLTIPAGGERSWSSTLRLN